MDGTYKCDLWLFGCRRSYSLLTISCILLKEECTLSEVETVIDLRWAQIQDICSQFSEQLNLQDKQLRTREIVQQIWDLPSLACGPPRFNPLNTKVGVSLEHSQV